MGLFKMFRNLFNSEGIREAMRMSYTKHMRQVTHGAVAVPDGTTPHDAGLYGALGSRYKARNKPVMEVVIWAELVPFLLMSKENSLDALIEYVIYQERPREAKGSWLRKVINDAFRMPPSSKDSPRSMAPLGMMNQVAWCDLLDTDIKRIIENEMQNHLSGFDGGA